MNVISVIIYAAELAVAAIVLFYVVEMLTMPGNMKRVLPGLDYPDCHPVGDRGATRLGSASNKPRRSACSKFTEQSQRRPVMAALARPRRISR